MRDKPLVLISILGGIAATLIFYAFWMVMLPGFIAISTILCIIGFAASVLFFTIVIIMVLNDELNKTKE